MHPRWLVESAGMWGYHGAMFAESQQPFEVSAVHAYWSSNRLRFDAWNGLLREHLPRFQSPVRSRRDEAWSQLVGLIEEVLLSEPLTRITVAVAMRLETREIDGESCAIMHNVFCSHLAFRHRCLKLALEGLDLRMEWANRINRLRVYLEQWTDMLLGFFSDMATAQEYAHSMERVAEYATEYGYRRLGNDAPMIWSLFLAGNRHWLDQYQPSAIPFQSLSQEVSHAALGMVHPGWFDSLGLLPSRLANSISQRLQFIDQTIESLINDSWKDYSSIQTQDQNTSRF